MINYIIFLNDITLQRTFYESSFFFVKMFMNPTNLWILPLSKSLHTLMMSCFSFFSFSFELLERLSFHFFQPWLIKLHFLPLGLLIKMNKNNHLRLFIQVSLVMNKKKELVFVILYKIFLIIYLLVVFLLVKIFKHKT